MTTKCDNSNIFLFSITKQGNPNAYDITTWDPNVDQITFTSEAFYNREDVKAALHAPDGHFWHGCQAGEGRRRLMNMRQLYMQEDRPFSVVPYLADLLDAGIPVVVYNGDRDMTTNMVGTELLLNEMEWSGKEGWLDAPRGLWKVDEYPAGWAKEYNGLSFVVVYNSGHMVSSQFSLKNETVCFAVIVVTICFSSKYRFLTISPIVPLISSRGFSQARAL